MYEDDADYARRRLQGTICLVNGTPKLITAVAGKRIGYSDDEGNQGEDALSAVDPVPSRLGYAKVGRGWGYFFRVPVRKWSQGHREDNTQMLLNGSAELRFMRPSVTQAKTAHFAEYQSKEQCIKDGGAFSRTFCVKQSDLYHKGHLVGSIVNGVIVLHPQYEFLSRRLEKSE